MKVIKEAEKVSPELREEIMDYLTDLYKVGYGWDTRVKDIMDEFDLDEETAEGLVSDWTKPDDEDDEEDGELNRYEMGWSQAEHAWMVVYAHDMREAEGKFEDGVELDEASDEGHCVMCGNPLTDDKYPANMDGFVCGACHEKGRDGDSPKYCPKCGCEFMPGSGTCDSCGYECDESVKHVLVKEDANDNTKSRTESLKLTADYFLGQLRGLVDKVSKEDSEGAKLFFKNANNTLKDLVRQFEDLKANF